MSRISGYQWICLRALRPSRTLSTSARRVEEPAQQEAIQPEPEPSPETPSTAPSPSNPNTQPSKEALKQFLHTQDDIALANLKAHLSTLTQSANALSRTLRSIFHSASKVQLLPEAPPYTIAYYRRLGTHDLPPLTARLLFHANTIYANLTDLQHIDYPNDVGLSKAQEFEREVYGMEKEEQEKKLLDLSLQERAHEARLKSSTSKMAEHVEQLESMARQKREERERVENPFIKVNPAPSTTQTASPAGVPMGGVADTPAVKGADTTAETKEGWGSGATKVEAGGQVQKTANPFRKKRERESKKVDAEEEAKEQKPKVSSGLADLQRKLEAQVNK